MGSLPRLKIKDELHYRKAPTSGGCEHCNHNVPVGNVEVKEIRSEYRCQIIGLNDSRRYRVRRGMICDRYDNSEYMRRLRREV